MFHAIGAFLIYGGIMVREHKIPICFDFDGVLHSFVTGWVADDIIPDAPLLGVKEALEWFSENGFLILVFSCRSATRSGRLAMKEWMHENDLPYDKICKVKPTARFYVDDHGFNFKDWDSTTTFFENYNKKEEQRVIDKIERVALWQAQKS
jgi:hypothetical protein